MLPFVSYTTFLLTYHQMSNKLSTCTLVDQDSQAAVLRALKCNPYVPNLLFRPNYDYNLPEEHAGYSSSRPQRSSHPQPAYLT